MTQNNQGIEAEAARWAVRLQASPLDPQEHGELNSWLETDTRHRGALLRAQAVWLDIDRLAALAAHREAREIAQPPAPARRALRNWRALVAASVATLSLASAGAWWVWGGSGDSYVSGVGEVRRVTLADGSSMLLNTATQATVHFDKAEREIQLVRGEGIFEVAKDAARPFVVRSGSVSVRALGTVFAVRALDGRVDVTVTEGVVEVVDTTGLERGVRYRVASNEQVVVTNERAVAIQPIAHAQAERRLAWRDGMVAFDGESLTDAVGEINRHNQRQIVVEGATLAARPVVGIFRASDADGFATTVAAALGAQSVDEGGVIHLRPRSTP